MSVPAWGKYDVDLNVQVDDDIDNNVKLMSFSLVAVTSMRPVHSSYIGESWLRLGERIMEHKQASSQDLATKSKQSILTCSW